MFKNLFRKQNQNVKEVKRMKKLILIVMLGLMLSIGTSTQALAQPFWVGSVCDPSANCVSDVMGFDWSSSGSGVAIGMGPFGTPYAPDTPFDFYYQASLVGLTDSIGNPITFPGLNTTFEYTIAAMIPETGTMTDLGGGLFQSIFTSQPGAIWSMYAHNGPNAVVADGTGFVDGDIVAYGTISPGQISTFLANLNTGMGIGSGILEGLVDYANPLYLEIAELIFDFRFEGTINYPPFDSTTSQFFGPGGYVVQPNDLLLKVDSSTKFSVVPEPATLLLLGAGLLGVGFARRKKK